MSRKWKKKKKKPVPVLAELESMGIHNIDEFLEYIDPFIENHTIRCESYACDDDDNWLDEDKHIMDDVSYSGSALIILVQCDDKYFVWPEYGPYGYTCPDESLEEIQIFQSLDEAIAAFERIREILNPS